MSPEKLQLSIFWQKENEYLYCCLHHRLSSICGSHSDLSQQRDVVSNGDSLSVKTGFSGSSYITKNLRKIQNVKISGTDYRLDYRGSILGTGKQFFFQALYRDRPRGPTQPPAQLEPGVLSPGVKRGRGGGDADNPPHLAPGPERVGATPSSPPKARHGVQQVHFAFCKTLNNENKQKGP